MDINTDECWIYAGFKDKLGYGSVGVYIRGKGKTSLRAHRVMYEAMIGPIPKGLVIDHLCRITACINPVHLEPVTNRENVLRMWECIPEPTHCPKGHAYTEDNIYYSKKTNSLHKPSKKCRTCLKEYISTHRPKIRVRKYKHKEPRQLSKYCGNGHEYTEENTYWYKRSDRNKPTRVCKICSCENVKAFYSRKKHLTS